MDELRLGDIIDDYCIKCRRMTNHAIVSIVAGEAAKVRCRSCYHDHTYLKEQIPPSKKDLKKLELFNAVLAGSGAPGTGSSETDEETPPAADSENGEAHAENGEPHASDSEHPEVQSADAKKPRGRAKKV
ncbi:MAG TPA: hypothetical protein VEX68_00160 [Bryobacteraceae bacterium]|nr:hypothetical protein [Bryobacteraceae bacterium]